MINAVNWQWPPPSLQLRQHTAFTIHTGRLYNIGRYSLAEDCGMPAGAEEPAMIADGVRRTWSYAGAGAGRKWPKKTFSARMMVTPKMSPMDRYTDFEGGGAKR